MRSILALIAIILRASSRVEKMHLNVIAYQLLLSGTPQLENVDVYTLRFHMEKVL
jgi:hypothetical protein